FTNNKNVTLSGTGERKVEGDVVNTGTWTVTETTATYTGTFTNSGAYISDPSIHNFVDFVITPSGFVQAGAGDEFHVTGDFKNESQQGALWVTDHAKLLIENAPVDPKTNHLFELAGLDLGASFLGYDNNFAWGELDLFGGETIDFADGNDGNASTAFY